jgi:lipopolysaccharide export system permease protein
MVPLITGTFIIAGLFAANELIAIFRNLNVQVIPGETIAQLVILSMPKWLVLTFPAGMAIGASLAVGRLIRESEITAMRAAGVPIRRVLWPVLIWGLIVAGLNFWVAEKVQPAANTQWRKISTEVFIVSAQPTFKSDTVISMGRYKVQLGSIERRSDSSAVLRDVFLFEVIGPEEMILYQAPMGTYEGGVWRFPSARVRWTRGDGLVSFKSKDVVINEPISMNQLMTPPDTSQLTVAEMREVIRQKQATGSSALPDQVELYNRFAIPASCVIFALTSAVAAIRFARTGPFAGLMLSLLIVGIYYNFHIVATKIIGASGLLSPAISAWLPNIVFGVLGLILYWGQE